MRKPRAARLLVVMQITRKGLHPHIVRGDQEDHRMIIFMLITSQLMISIDVFLILHKLKRSTEVAPQAFVIGCYWSQGSELNGKHAMKLKL